MGFVQIFCYLSFCFSICRHCEYQFHYFSRFWVYNQMMLIFWIFNISIFGKSRHIFTVFSMCFHSRTNFSGQISAVHCIQHIFNATLIPPVKPEELILSKPSLIEIIRIPRTGRIFPDNSPHPDNLFQILKSPL